ncbi:MAG: RidA family protein [Pseudomonadota bacterium]
MAAPAGNYVAVMQAGNLLYIAGQLPKTAEGHLYTGRLGADVTVEDGQKAAAACALNILAQVAAASGALERIEAVLRLNGFVNATPDFTDHPKVIDGASDVVAAILGDVGRHTRVAVGVAGLPFNASVEIDAVLQLKP